VHWPPIRIAIGKSLPEDREVRDISEFYHNLVVKEMDTPIGYTDVALDGSVASVRCQESNLGNLVTDLMKSTCQTDIGKQRTLVEKSSSTLFWYLSLPLPCFSSTSFCSLTS